MLTSLIYFLVLSLSSTSPSDSTLVLKCDSLESHLYLFERSVEQVESCSCIRKYEFKDIVKSNCDLMEQASKCVTMKPRVQALKTRIKQVRKQLN